MAPKQRKNAKKKGNKNETASGSGGDDDDEKVDVGFELDKALTALAKSRARMLELYVQWKDVCTIGHKNDCWSRLGTRASA